MQQAGLFAQAAFGQLQLVDAAAGEECCDNKGDQYDGAADAADDQVDAVPEIDAGAVGGDEVAFLLYQPARGVADVVHRLLAGIGQDDLDRFIEAQVLGDVDGLGQFEQLVVDRILEALGGIDFRRRDRQQAAQFVEGGRDLHDRRPVGRQVLLLARQDIAALSRFGVLDLGQQQFGGLDDRDAVLGKFAIGVGGCGGVEDDNGADGQKQDQKDQCPEECPSCPLHVVPARSRPIYIRTDRGKRRKASSGGQPRWRGSWLGAGPAGLRSRAEVSC